jgi:hypothetical protein
MTTPEKLAATIEQHAEPFTAFMLSRAKIAAISMMIDDLKELGKDLLESDGDEAAAFMEAAGFEPDELEFLTAFMILQTFDPDWEPCREGCKTCEVVAKIREGINEWDFEPSEIRNGKTPKSSDNEKAVEELLQDIEIED